MRISRSVGLLAVVITFGAYQVSAAQATLKISAAADKIAHAGDMSHAFPTVAKNQLRTPRLIVPLNLDPLPPGDGGGDYTFNACNCKRKCETGTCRLKTYAVACKSVSGGNCESCDSTYCGE